MQIFCKFFDLKIHCFCRKKKGKYCLKYNNVAGGISVVLSTVLHNVRTSVIFCWKLSSANLACAYDVILSQYKGYPKTVE